MRTSATIITALSVAGPTAAAGSAFTGAGLNTSGTASSALLIGGTVSNRYHQGYPGQPCPGVHQWHR